MGCRVAPAPLPRSSGATSHPHAHFPAHNRRTDHEGCTRISRAGPSLSPTSLAQSESLPRSAWSAPTSHRLHDRSWRAHRRPRRPRTPSRRPTGGTLAGRAAGCHLFACRARALSRMPTLPHLTHPSRGRAGWAGRPCPFRRMQGRRCAAVGAARRHAAHTIVPLSSFMAVCSCQPPRPC